METVIMIYREEGNIFEDQVTFKGLYNGKILYSYDFDSEDVEPKTRSIDTSDVIALFGIEFV